MKINDILKEDGDTSGDYQQMIAFTQANRVGGVPEEQQIPLALFKELKKQKQQNQALSTELSDAEKRINQATATGELSQQELNMHRGELDRERTAGEKQQATVGQLGQKYAEREKASDEQIQQLTNQLEMVKNKPGVNPEAAKQLEQQIKELGEKSVSLNRLQELESSIAAVQNMQTVDDSTIKDLVAKVNQAQEATKELAKTRQTVGQDAEQTAKRALDQVEQIKQQLAHFREVEQTVLALQPMVQDVLAPKVNDLSRRAALDDKVKNIKAANAVKDELKGGAQQMRTPQPAPAPDTQMSLPGVTESQMNKAIKWAIGRNK